MVLNGSFRIVEHLGGQIPLVFFERLIALEFFQRLLSFLQLYSLFSSLFGFSCVHWVMSLLVNAFSFHIVKLTVDILLQVLFLNADPLITVELHRFEGVTDLILCKLSVLSECVKADDILYLLSKERLCRDFRPDARIVSVFLIISFALFLTLLLFLLMLTLLLFLILQPLSDA